MGQRHAKARLIAEEWVASGLDAAALGAFDWELGAPFVRETVKRSGYPVVAANLVCEGGERPFPAARVVEHGGRRIGIVGVTVGEVEGCVVTDPAEAAKQARELMGDVDAAVLLWPAREEEANVAARAGLPFDFLVDASGRSGRTTPERAGQTWLLGGGIKTKAVSVARLSFVEGGKAGFFPEKYDQLIDEEIAKVEKYLVTAQRQHDGEKTTPTARVLIQRKIDAKQTELAELKELRASATSDGQNVVTIRTITLDQEIADHEATLAHVEAVKATFSAMDDASGAEVVARPMRIEHGPYAGTEACVKCHPTQYNQWRSTEHARAMSSLVAVSRHRDEDCFSCHVTGGAPAEIAGFPVTIETSDAVGGGNNVQCEACHGPGRDHVGDPTKHRTVKDPDEALCRACHTPEQDDGRFDFAAYLPKVTHPTPE
ncbi:MAG: hypothetical protein H6737_09995 [Alphaproteobacteria bacterium]|nr:hypothetical protein [Alphaproteobacteria bacterium]